MRTVYEVRATRVEGWWVLTAPEVPGAVSQVRSLDDAEQYAREALAFVLNVEPGSFDVVVHPT